MIITFCLSPNSQHHHTILWHLLSHQLMEEELHREPGCFSSLGLWGAHCCSLSRWSCCISVCQNNFPVCTHRGPPGSLYVFIKCCSSHSPLLESELCAEGFQQREAEAPPAETLKAERRWAGWMFPCSGSPLCCCTLSSGLSGFLFVGFFFFFLCCRHQKWTSVWQQGGWKCLKGKLKEKNIV